MDIYHMHMSYQAKLAAPSTLLFLCHNIYWLYSFFSLNRIKASMILLNHSYGSHANSKYKASPSKWHSQSGHLLFFNIQSNFDSSNVKLLNATEIFRKLRKLEHGKFENFSFSKLKFSLQLCLPEKKKKKKTLKFWSKNSAKVSSISNTVEPR